MKVDGYQNVMERVNKSKIPAMIKRVVAIMLDKKAEKVVTLKLKGINRITNFMVICTGNSSRQNHAISKEIQEELKKELKLRAFSVEGLKNAEWILLDYIDFIVHVFLPEVREKYLIEKLWMDAKRYDFYQD
jgi:ribosome-associated protein